MAQQPAGEAQSSNVPPETILYYTHALTRTKRKIDEANSAHRLIVKQAKADGCPTDAILESIKLARLEPDERRARLADRVRVEMVRYPQDAPQLTDLLGGLDTAISDGMRNTNDLFSAEQRGYLAGKYGVPADDNPFEAGSEAAQRWRTAWGEGQEAGAVQGGAHAKPASTRRQKRPPKTESMFPKEAKPKRRHRRTRPLPESPAAGNGAQADA